jgi:tape measure domain-containing protein
MGGDQRILEIVLRARDEATKVVKQIGDQTGDMAEKMKSALSSAVAPATAITGAFALLGKTAVDTAASYEQNRIAFEVMLGSADKAKTLLSDLSKFATETPFDLPQVVDGAKRLSAYGIEAEQIIPTFKMLGNIAAGVGTDKLPQLILAFGQVRAATKLTGAELRQFSEAGVPLLGALVEQANQAGGVLTKVGGASKETTKKIGSLSSQIVDAEYKLKFFKDTGGKTTKQLESMQKNIDLNKKKLSEFGTVGQEIYKRVQVTAADMIDRISDGTVSFDEMQKALQGMQNQEGDQFFDLMGRQAKTFSGTLSNVRDEFVRFSLAVLGVEDTGDIREGSIFFYLKQGATAFLELLKTGRPVAQSFIDTLLGNKDALIIMFGALLGLITPLVIAFIAFIAPALAFAVAGAAIAGALRGYLKMK